MKTTLTAHPTALRRPGRWPAATALATAGLALSSYVSVPMTPVPVTMQTFAVTIAGALLGPAGAPNPASLKAGPLVRLLTYVGTGYSPELVANYDRIAVRLSSGEFVLVVEGPDGVCGPVLDVPGSHCRREGVSERDARAAAAVGMVLARVVEAGVTLTLDASTVGRMRSAFATGSVRGACYGCEWSGFCDNVAVRGYPGVRVA